MEFKEYTLKEIMYNFKYGTMPNKTKIRKNSEGGYPIFTGYLIPGYYDEWNIENETLIVVARGVGGTGDVKLTPQKCFLTNLSIAMFNDEKIVINKYLYYYFKKHNLRYLDSGSAQSQITINDLKNVKVPIPNKEIQKKVVKILEDLDKKIELNNQMNENLYNQAVVIYKNKFQSTGQADCCIGDYLLPKRGKNLLTRDAILGDVPVVAGGLEPATYHNTSNTKAPVITISASGANAGYVNLWSVQVWSSDSSYIDNDITENVYFWYVTLKTRQKEIFDAQTGSAQPHIYPQHIAELPINMLNGENVLKYEKEVTPFFEMIGKNKAENKYLEQLRDTLLPKLMNGEINLDKVKI